MQVGVASTTVQVGVASTTVQVGVASTTVQVGVASTTVQVSVASTTVHVRMPYTACPTHPLYHCMGANVCLASSPSCPVSPFMHTCTPCLVNWESTNTSNSQAEYGQEQSCLSAAEGGGDIVGRH